MQDRTDSRKIRRARTASALAAIALGASSAVGLLACGEDREGGSVQQIGPDTTGAVTGGTTTGGATTDGTTTGGTTTGGDTTGKTTTDGSTTDVTETD
jgi:hypothetical protein